MRYIIPYTVNNRMCVTMHVLLLPYTEKFSQDKSFVDLVKIDFHGVKLLWVCYRVVLLPW